MLFAAYLTLFILPSFKEFSGYHPEVSTASSRALSPYSRLRHLPHIFRESTPQASAKLARRSRTTRLRLVKTGKTFFNTSSIRWVITFPHLPVVWAERYASARCFYADYFKLTKVRCHSTWLTSISANTFNIYSAVMQCTALVAHGYETPPC